MTQEESPKPPNQETTWREEIKAKQKGRPLMVRAGCTITGITTHERIWSWAFKRPVTLKFRQKRMDVLSATELVVSTWGKPWMKKRLFGFSLGRLRFKGLQVGTIGLFAIGLGLPLCCLTVAVNRMAMRLTRKLNAPPPVVQTVPTQPTPSR